MLTRRPPALRIAPLLRPVRCSNQSDVPRPRLFTQNHPLLLLTRTTSPRPQLPYLSQPCRHPQSLPRGPALQRQLARLLSTETRRYLREQTWLATKWTAAGWTCVFLVAVACYAWQMELVDRDHPSPPEWSFWARRRFRHGYAWTDPANNASGQADWAVVGSEFRYCLEMLESSDQDGKGLERVYGTPGVEEGPEVEGAAYDVSSKSYPWREGYFEVVMGCANAAEYLDDMVRDKTRKIVFPKAVVVGPSNPNPRPTPPNMHTAPLEENCDRPYAPPETFYMRILAGVGFSTRQRLDASLAYANWLDFKGDPEAAEEVYKQGIALASAVLPVPETVNTKSFTLSEAGTATASPNLLRATTALATHLARHGDVSRALPIFLSVLRARRTTPIDPLVEAASRGRTGKANEEHSQFYRLYRTVIRSSAYPAEGPSGDEPLIRTTVQAADCAEAELMLYIGEILYASRSSQPEEGVGWTKQALEVAERGVRQQNLSAGERAQCKACLDTGLSNWSTMVRKLVREEKEATEREGVATGWKSWFGAGPTKQTTVQGRWEEEAGNVEELRVRLVRDGITQQMLASSGVPGSVWIG